MNTTVASLITTTGGGNVWGISPETISTILLVIVGINALGVVGNGLLVVGLVLLRGSGKLSRASVQMLLQQAVIDFLNCVTAIA